MFEENIQRLTKTKKLSKILSGSKRINIKSLIFFSLHGIKMKQKVSMFDD